MIDALLNEKYGFRVGGGGGVWDCLVVLMSRCPAFQSEDIMDVTVETSMMQSKILHYR